VSLLRRLFGGANRDADAVPSGPPPTQAEVEAAELEHEREVMRAEAERLDDLRQRQLRYAEHAWTPPAQGGEKRADDEDSTSG
jgi:hypothetical protein